MQDGLRGHKAPAGSGLFSMCGHAPQYPGNQKDHGEGFGAGGPTVFPQKTIEQGEQGFEHDHLPTQGEREKAGCPVPESVTNDG